MNILVIGNGFDLAHDLPTSYWNFLDFVIACQDFTHGDLHGGSYYGFCSKFQRTAVFDEINEHLNINNRLLQYILKRYTDLYKAGKNTWIDFEKELSFVCKLLYKARKEGEANGRSIKKMAKDDKKFLEKLVTLETKDVDGPSYLSEDFVEGQSEELHDSLRRLTRLLEIFLSEYVEKIPVSLRLPECTELDFDHVLSFNYTHTFRRLYDNGQDLYWYSYPHGEINDIGNMNKCNMVLGIDEFLDEPERTESNYFMWFKKFYQRIYNRTDTSYINWINEMKGGPFEHRGKLVRGNEIYFYGHSMNVTDKDVLRNLIFPEGNYSHIFYYDEDKDLAPKIANLVKVIGEEELIKRTGGSNASIVFTKTRRPVHVEY